MNREILFRAKGQTSDKWYEGLLTRLDKDVCHIKDIRHNEWICDPETVFQYTGLADKNGRKIFEGDIIKREIIGSFVIGEIAWVDIGFCGFYLKCRNSYYPMGKDNEYTGKSECDEVIGNIFDNPELLKE